MSTPELRYPIGPFRYEGSATPAQRSARIGEIAALPDRLRAAVRDLTPEQWETQYRPDGWTVRQVVHHLPDSHLNGYVRFKLALTEATPTIKPYDQAAWAELPDVPGTSPDVSLALLSALHQRWVALLRALQPTDFERAVYHPEKDRTVTLDEFLALYAWHGRHHLAHITTLQERQGWQASQPHASP